MASPDPPVGTRNPEEAAVSVSICRHTLMNKTHLNKQLVHLQPSHGLSWAHVPSIPEHEICGLLHDCLLLRRRVQEPFRAKHGNIIAKYVDTSSHGPEVGSDLCAPWNKRPLQGIPL